MQTSEVGEVEMLLTMWFRHFVFYTFEKYGISLEVTLVWNATHQHGGPTKPRDRVAGNSASYSGSPGFEYR
jgi:hypothetical protein